MVCNPKYRRQKDQKMESPCQLRRYRHNVPQSRDRRASGGCGRNSRRRTCPGHDTSTLCGTWRSRRRRRSRTGKQRWQSGGVGCRRRRRTRRTTVCLERSCISVRSTASPALRAEGEGAALHVDAELDGRRAEEAIAGEIRNDDGGRLRGLGSKRWHGPRCGWPVRALGRPEPASRRRAEP